MDAFRPADVAALMGIIEASHTGDAIFVDDFDDVTSALLSINRGMGSEQFFDLVRNAASRGALIVLAGARAITTSRVAALLDTRIMLRHNDASEYSLAGLRPATVPHAMPPGRAVLAPSGHVMQFVFPAAGGDANPHMES